MVKTNWINHWQHANCGITKISSELIPMGCSQVSIVFLKMWYAKNVIIRSIIRSKSRRIMCMRKSSKHPHKTLYDRTISSKNSVSRPRTISNWHNHTYSQWNVENDEWRPKIRKRIPWFDSHRSRCILEPGGSFCHDDSLVPRYGTILSTHRTRAEYWRSSDKMTINIGIGWRGSESRQWVTMSVRIAGYRPSKRGRWWRYRRWYWRFRPSSHHSHIRWWDWTW